MTDTDPGDPSLRADRDLENNLDRLKRKLRPLLLLLLAAPAAAVACHPAAEPDPGPVVIYLIDTLRPDRMSAYGAVRATTPAAEEFAEESVLYKNAFAVSTWTRPSVATLLTGLLPSGTKTLNRWGRLDESAWYLPQELHRKGWKTAAFVANGNVFDERLGFQRGMDVFKSVVHASDGSWHATAREVVDPAVDFIRRADAARFLLYVHVVDPHMPYVLEPGMRDQFAGPPEPNERIPRDYERSIRQADEQFPRIVAALRGRGFWARSTVLYLSDHGEEFFEHGGTSHGHAAYDEQLRIPLIVKYPDGHGKATVVSDPVSIADVAPTLAEIHSLPPSSEWIGTSLWRRSPLPDRDLYFTEDLDENRLYGLRRGRQKLIIRLYPAVRRELFDLETDAMEQHGTEFPCGASEASDAALFESLNAWRLRDVAGFPSLRFQSRSTSVVCQALVELSGIRRPFLTAQDHCEWSGKVRNAQLRFRDRAPGPAGGVLVSADDSGRLPQVDFDRARPTCLIDAVRATLLQGPTSDAHAEQLRSLGYLQ